MGYPGPAPSWHRTSGGSSLINFFGPLTEAVKYLIIVNVAIFFLSVFLPPRGPDVLDYLTRFLALYPANVIPGLQLWRPLTYMFAHADVTHLLLNMLTLWWFGSPVEQLWGRKKFLLFYFACGTGAGLVCVPFYLLTGSGSVPIVGASGALFGLLTAFALIYPNARVYLMFLFPLKAKWVVIFWMALEFAATVSYAGGGGVANIAHLTGGIIGYFYLRRLMDLRYYWLRLRSGGKKRPYRIISAGSDDRPEPPSWLH